MKDAIKKSWDAIKKSWFERFGFEMKELFVLIFVSVCMGIAAWIMSTILW